MSPSKLKDSDRIMSILIEKSYPAATIKKSNLFHESAKYVPLP